MLCIKVNRTNVPGDKFMTVYFNNQAVMNYILHLSLSLSQEKGNDKTDKEKWAIEELKRR